MGLDISTSCTGVCCLDSSGKIVHIEPIVLTKHTSFSEKCEFVKERLQVIKKDFNVDRVFIEQNLSSFRRGLSSAHTINTLARFNGACSYVSYQVFQVDPVSLNVTNARNHLKIKIDHKDKTKNTKQKVFEWVSSQVSIDWPLKKSGEIKEIAYDMADAYVIALAGSMGCKE
jgi:Holliday junction resolvasome RuvABC endonuclease subunit